MYCNPSHGSRSFGWIQLRLMVRCEPGHEKGNRLKVLGQSYHSATLLGRRKPEERDQKSRWMKVQSNIKKTSIAPLHRKTAAPDVGTLPSRTGAGFVQFDRSSIFLRPHFSAGNRKTKTETYNRIFKVHPPKIKLLPVYLTAHFFRSPLPEVVSAAIQFISRGILKFNRIL